MMRKCRCFVADETMATVIFQQFVVVLAAIGRGLLTNIV